MQCCRGGQQYSKELSQQCAKTYNPDTHRDQKVHSTARAARATGSKDENRASAVEAESPTQNCKLHFCSDKEPRESSEQVRWSFALREQL